MTETSKQERTGATGQLLVVSVGRPKTVDRQGKPAETAIWKQAVSGPVAVEGVNVAGDDQADRNAHGGYDKAVYAYSEADLLWWENELGREIGPGGFGENLTVSGIDVTNSVVGERWQVGTVTLEVSEPRVPCWKLELRMGEAGFINRFNAANRPGTYLRIIEPGTLKAGDQISVHDVPDDGLTIGDVARIYSERQGAERLVDNHQISDAWRAWAARVVK